MNIFSIFSRSRMYANLTPGERAFLRFLVTLAGGAFLAGAQAVAPLLSSPTMDPASVPWASVLHTFLVAFALAVWVGIGKYRSAQGDPPLPTVAPLAAPVQPAQPVAPVAAPPASSLDTSSSGS